MPITTVTARDFVRDFARAKRAADGGPVIVTDRGQPRYALLKIEDCYRLSEHEPRSLLAPDGRAAGCSRGVRGAAAGRRRTAHSRFHLSGHRRPMFLRDTKVISELRAGKPNQSPGVRAWAAQVSAAALKPSKPLGPPGLNPSAASRGPPALDALMARWHAGAGAGGA